MQDGFLQREPLNNGIGLRPAPGGGKAAGGNLLALVATLTTCKRSPELQDWKAGQHVLGSVPAYQPNAGAEDVALSPDVPEMMVAIIMEDGGRKSLSLPNSFRTKWAADPVRKGQWLSELQLFDARLLISIQS